MICDAYKVNVILDITTFAAPSLCSTAFSKIWSLSVVCFITAYTGINISVCVSNPLSGFSGTIPLDSIVLSGFNFYLGLPIIALGMMDVDASTKDIYRYPYLAYSTGRNGEMLNLNTMGR